tara:strand:- start:244 stop:672 length:429 start_codon:yes stop_codon:yes gene_type:complete
MSVKKLDEYIQRAQFLKVTKEIAGEKGLEIRVKEESKTNKGKGDIEHREEVIELEIFDGKDLVYGLKQKNEFRHERGSGGYWNHKSVLSKINGEKEKVLESKKNTSWDTCSDDSIDYQSGHFQYTELYSEGGLGSEIFARFI